jgi:hypothetical protein
MALHVGRPISQVVNKFVALGASFEAISVNSRKPVTEIRFLRGDLLNWSKPLNEDEKAMRNFIPGVMAERDAILP